MMYIIKILTFWIPIKKWRKNCRNKLLNLFLLKRFMRKVTKKYPEGIFLLSPHSGIGEFVQSLCLMKALKHKISKQIVIITSKKTEEDICKLYNNTVSCYYDPNLKIYETNNISESLEPGKLYPFYALPKPTAIKRTKDIDFLKDFFLLPQNAKIEKIKPHRPKKIDDSFLKLENIFKTQKTILLFPDANTYDSTVVTNELWIEVASRLQNAGYTCIFNSNEVFKGFLNIFLPIDKTMYLSSLATTIITFRSGLSELLALATNCKMLVIYPNGTTNLFKKECNINIDCFVERLKNSPIILEDPDNPVVSSFKVGSLSENFDRKNCKNFYYDFDNVKFINFLMEEIS